MKQHVQGKYAFELRERIAAYNIPDVHVRVCGESSTCCVVTSTDERLIPRWQNNANRTWVGNVEAEQARAADAARCLSDLAVLIDTDAELELTAEELVREHRGW